MAIIYEENCYSQSLCHVRIVGCVDLQEGNGFMKKIMK